MTKRNPMEIKDVGVGVAVLGIVGIGGYIVYKMTRTPEIPGKPADADIEDIVIKVSRPE